MHLNKIKTKIGLEIFKIKKNFEIFGKLKKNYTLHFTLKKNEPLYDLVYNGYDFHKKLLTDEDINFIIQKYVNKLKLTNDKTFDYNLTFPFFDKKIMQKVFNSEIIEKINGFFLKVYNVKPVLQQSPMIVITKPSIENKDMNKSVKIPADYHTDYPTEMAIHIPLNDLKENSIHTVYCEKSNRHLLTKSTSKYGDKFVSKFKKVKLSTTKGNAIILDTQGIHRANVKKGDLRIMLFLKFSSKNNLIYDVDYSENSDKSKLSEYFNFNNQILENDRDFALRNGYLDENQCKIYNYFTK